MSKLIKRAKYSLLNEEGDQTIQQVSMMAVALIVAGALFVFGGKIKSFVSGAGDKIDGLGTSTDSELGDQGW